MRGRPKNIKNASLVGQLNEFKLDHRITLAEMAGMIGISASTLSRSMTSQCFSEDAERRARRLLNPSAEKLAALHLLQEFAIKLPEIQQALDLLLDRPGPRE
ncbi:hypothetical protein ACI3KW_12170 [Devosia sp. ZW T5_3]|uniref:hypothetical protein n=1 Tax=Devosia sp. ZW T5_3 TaxID=3378085 RepID=UPI003852A0C1